MSMAQAAPAPMSRVEGRRISSAAALWNLFVKELRESRSALIVGVFAFWLVPVFLGLTACGFERGDGLQVFGMMAYALLLSGGWLFAAAFGTNIVCRDWGRSEEHFLLAQPVTPRWVVAAKLLAAVAVVGLIVGVLLVIVHLLMLFTVDSTHREDLSVPEALVVCLVVASLALSFSIAVITRQTSASLVLTMLIMALGIAAPLVSTRFSFLHPDWDLLSQIQSVRGASRRPTLSESWYAYTSLLTCLAVCVLGSLTAAFVLCTRERAIRIGHKPLAWTVALAALLVFGAGMTEVGKSADICDRVVLWNQPEPGHAVLHCEANRGYAACAWGAREARHIQLADLSIDSDGRIGSLRSSEVLPAAIRLSDASGAEVRPVPYAIGELKPTGKDAFTIVGMVSEGRLLGGGGLCRLEVRWDERAGFQATSTTIAGEEAGPKEAEAKLGLWSSMTWTDRYAYLLYIEEQKSSSDDRRSESPGRKTTRSTLRVYDWSTGPWAAEVLELPIPIRCWLRLEDSQIILYDSRASLFVGSVPLDDVQAIKDLFAEGMPKPRPLNDKEIERLSRRSRGNEWYGRLRFTQHQVTYEIQTDNNGLRSQRIAPGQLSDPVRAYRCSVLARMMRFGGGLRALDSTLLAQEAGRAIIFYDISDPLQIRRIGFHNTLSGYPVQLEQADGHLLVLEQANLTVLRRPKTAQPGSPTSSWQAPAAGGG